MNYIVTCKTFTGIVPTGTPPITTKFAIQGVNISGAQMLQLVKTLVPEADQFSVSERGMHQYTKYC